MNNILLIVIDCLREDMVRGKYMPFLHSLKKKGIYFNNVYAQSSWTKTSIASMMTGKFPFEHGVNTIKDKLPDELPTLAESLTKKGYDTFHTTSHHYLTVGKSISRGFNSRFIDWGKDVNDIILIEELLKFTKQTTNPSFCYFHLMDLHPYYCNYNKYKETSLIVDSNLKLLLEGINKNNTMIIITADHGFGFGEHGIYAHNPGLYNELIKVPLLIMGGWKDCVMENYRNLKFIYELILNPNDCQLNKDEIIYSERWNTSNFQRIQAIIKDDWKLIYYSRLNKWNIVKSYFKIYNMKLFLNVIRAGKNYFKRRKVRFKYTGELFNLIEDSEEKWSYDNEPVYKALFWTMEHLIESSKKHQYDE